MATSRTPKGYPGHSVTSGETGLLWRDLTFPQAISRALDELRANDSRKALAPLFDGRDGREVGETTVSRWVTEPTRFPAHCLPVLVARHPQFRQFLFEHLAARMVTPAEVLNGLSPKAAEEYQRLMEERMRDAAFGGPNRMGERYA